jgi:hypothetical protein
MTDLPELTDFLDPPTCDDVIAELSDASGRATTVLGHDAHGSVAERTRKTTRLAVAPETREGIESIARHATIDHWRSR